MSTRSSETKSWIPSPLCRPRHWRLSSRRLPEPFAWRGLHRPSAVSDRSRRLEASSPVRSFPCPDSPSSSAEGSPRSIQGQNEQFLKTCEPFSGHFVPSDPIRDHEDPAITNSTSDAAWTVSRTPSMLIPKECTPPVLTSSNPLSTRQQRFACARLSQSYLPKSRSDFSATFTTIAFDDSSLRWLEINT
jgi:hypothetical protein